MIRNYSDYINLINEAYTGTNPSPRSIYWSHQLDNVINKEWTQISVVAGSSPTLEIKFRTGDEKNDYYLVLFEKAVTDVYYLTDDETSKKFQEKLKIEFWKAPEIYYKNIKKIRMAPKCLGDISHLADADKYNI
jgi:hypothetical protein